MIQYWYPVLIWYNITEWSLNPNFRAFTNSFLLLFSFLRGYNYFNGCHGCQSHSQSSTDSSLIKLRVLLPLKSTIFAFIIVSIKQISIHFWTSLNRLCHFLWKAWFYLNTSHIYEGKTILHSLAFSSLFTVRCLFIGLPFSFLHFEIVCLQYFSQ